MEAGGGSNPIKLPVAATTASNEKIVVRILLQQTNLDMVRISTNPAGEQQALLEGGSYISTVGNPRLHTCSQQRE